MKEKINSTKGKKVIFNNENTKMYADGLKQMAENIDIKEEIYVTQLAKFPDIISVENDEDEELIWSELSIPLEEALTKKFLKILLDLSKII